MSNPTPDAEREGFVHDSDTGEWVRKEQVVQLFSSGLRDICSLARCNRDRERLEEIRKAGEVAGWFLQDLDYEEKDNGTHEG